MSDIIHIFEANSSIVLLSQQHDMNPEKVMLIRIGKLFSNITKELIPGLPLTRASRRGKYKLERIEVNYIINSSESHKELAEMFCIAENTISDIKTGRTYPRLTRKPYQKRVFQTPLTRKLTEAQVIQILEMLQTQTNAKVADHFNVTKQLISNIRCGRLWKNIPRPPSVKKHHTGRGINHYNRKIPKEVVLAVVQSDLPTALAAKKFDLDRSTIKKYRSYTENELTSHPTT